MNMNFGILGGDLRSFFLAKQLSKEKNEVKIYGFEKIENLKQQESYETILLNSNVIILPIPLTRDKSTLNMPFSNQKIEIKELINKLENKKIFVGNIPTEIKNQLEEKNNKVIDFMEKEEFAILNAIPTAEATIEIILKHTKKILQASECLIMGYGRIGKVLAHKLKGMSAKVTCMITNEVEKAWAIAYGHDIITIQNLKNNFAKVKQFDVIINTIPTNILYEELKQLKKETLIIDLASKPYGIDRKLVEQEKLNFVEALGLPGKSAPTTSAKYMKDIIKQYV